MQEITRIITTRITFIGEADEIPNADDIRDIIEVGLCADNVVIDNVQDFILDKDEPEQKKNLKDAIRHFLKGECYGKE